MYLKAKLYTSKYQNKKMNDKLRECVGEIYSVRNSDTIEISFECGYWRKAYQFHHWFAENVQEGKDDCETYDVSREQLQELIDFCKNTLTEEISDDDYKGDLIRTIEILMNALSLSKESVNQYFYRSNQI